MLKSKSANVTQALDGERFDLAACKLFPDVSRKKIKLILDSGGAYLNKKRVQIAKYQVKLNDKIEIFWEESSQQEKDNNVRNKNNSFACVLSLKDLIFEHKDFFIVNKPAGIASQATLTSSTDTIFHMLQKLDSKRFNIKDMFLVHRLDKHTSGIMIIARNKVVQNKFEELFRERKITKTYDALCFHVPKKDTGTLSFPIAKNNAVANSYFAVTNANSKIKNAKEAKTDYKLIQNFKNEVSQIQCYPRTGRTHQIRVHLAAIGCPILGDKTYSQNIYGHRYAQIALRQMLHASKLEFEFDNNLYQFESPFPEDFKQVIQLLIK